MSDILDRCGRLANAGAREFADGTVLARSGAVNLSVHRQRKRLAGAHGDHYVQIVGIVPITLDPEALANALDGLARSVRVLSRAVREGHPNVDLTANLAEEMQEII